MVADLASFFNIPAQGTASAEAPFTAFDREFGTPPNDRKLEAALTEYFNAPANNIPGKPMQGLLDGLTRALNVGRYEIVMAVGRTIDARAHVPGAYATAASIIRDPQRSDAWQRFSYAAEPGLDIGIKLDEVARNLRPSSQLPRYEDAQFMAGIKANMESRRGAIALGYPSYQIEQSGDDVAKAYVARIKETVVKIIAQGREELLPENIKYTVTENNGQLICRAPINSAGTIEVRTGSTPNDINTLVTNGTNNFNHGFECAVPMDGSTKFFGLKATSQIEKNAVGTFFANQNELDAAVREFQNRQTSTNKMAELVKDVKLAPALPAETPVNPVVGAKLASGGRELP